LSSCAELAPSLPVPLLLALPPLSSPPQPAATNMVAATAMSSAVTPRRLTGAERPSLRDMVLFLLTLMNRVIGRPRCLAVPACLEDLTGSTEFR
jgi:hypothetical protein